MPNHFQVLLACSAFCAEAGAQTVSPSNLPANYCAGSAANSLIVSTSTALSTDADCTFVQPQPGGTNLCVMSYQDITIASGAVLTIAGSQVAALTALGTITIQGTIDARSAGSGSDGGDGGDASSSSAGGGGAGGNAIGGYGGGPGGFGGFGGALTAIAVELVPLSGGSHGGRGGNYNSTSGSGLGGRGGGGLQLTACGSLAIASGAIITVPGRGGAGAGPAGGGGGGGSGGNLLVEANALSISGVIAANGGGGGSGFNSTYASVAGEDGRPGATPASGGIAVSPAGSGGNGGTQVGPTSGSSGTTAGGGGGAGGRIRINACSSLDTSSATISPPATIGFSCPSDRIFANGFE